MASYENPDSLASQTPRLKTPRRPKKENLNPLVQALSSFLLSLPKTSYNHDFRSELGQLSRLPHRYTIYGPLLLLPPTSFYPISHGPDIEGTPSSSPMSPVFPSNSFLTPSQRTTLYEAILSSFNRAGKKITHIAINAPIRQTTTSGSSNTTRAPTNLVPILGDFGPMPSSHSDEHASRSKPTVIVFSNALWATDTITFPARNLKVNYTWAPVYTMYSQGNLSEKRRILLGRRASSGEPTQTHPGTFHGLDGKSGELSQGLADIAVVDFYVGIGYFAFPYLCRGVERVWGFDLSPWAIEGCQRGAKLNGISCRTSSLGNSERLSGKEVQDIGGGCERLVIFHSDNAAAPSLLSAVKMEVAKGNGKWNNVRHVNLGLLPSSEGAWEGAVEVLDWELGGWVHVHENVAEEDIEAKKTEAVGAFQVLVDKRDRAVVEGVGEDTNGPADGWRRKPVKCVHVEKVKTYAPGVWHVVFDVYVFPRNSESSPSELGMQGDEEEDGEIRGETQVQEVDEQQDEFKNEENFGGADEGKSEGKDDEQIEQEEEDEDEDEEADEGKAGEEEDDLFVYR